METKEKKVTGDKTESPQCAFSVDLTRLKGFAIGEVLQEDLWATVKFRVSVNPERTFVSTTF